MDILISIIIIIAGISIPSLVNVSPKDKNILKLLWLYHLLFSVYYDLFIRADSHTYWRYSRTMTSSDFWVDIQMEGTSFINALTYIPANLFNLSYFPVTLIFSLLGYIGLIFFYKIIVTLIPTNSRFWKIRLFPFLLFLPSLHLWSAAIGKDSLLFFCIGFFVYGLMHIKKRFVWMLFCLFVSYHIRPHVALIMLACVGGAFWFRKDIPSMGRIVIVVLIAIIVGLLLSSIRDHFNIDDDSLEATTQFMDRMAEAMSYGNSAIDISEYPYPLKLFTFLYRPFFFDINGIPAAIVSFENLLLLLLTIRVFRNHPVRTFKNAPFVIQFLSIFLVIGALVFCEVISNLGNIMRQRNMFLPGMLIYFLWASSYNGNKKKRVRSYKKLEKK